jgi:hypothetical protein
MFLSEVVQKPPGGFCQAARRWRAALNRNPVPEWVDQEVYLHPNPKQTITMSNPFRISAEKVREHSSRKTSFSKLQARYEPDE